MSLGNLLPFEGTLGASPEEKEFSLPVRKITLSNDSSNTLSWKLNSSETYATLKPGEVVQIEDVRVTSVWLSGSGVQYRLWGLG